MRKTVRNNIRISIQESLNRLQEAEAGLKNPEKSEEERKVLSLRIRELVVDVVCYASTLLIGLNEEQNKQEANGLYFIINAMRGSVTQSAQWTVDALVRDGIWRRAK